MKTPKTNIGVIHPVFFRLCERAAKEYMVALPQYIIHDYHEAYETINNVKYLFECVTLEQGEGNVTPVSFIKAHFQEEYEEAFFGFIKEYFSLVEDLEAQGWTVDRLELQLPIPIENFKDKLDKLLEGD